MSNAKIALPKLTEAQFDAVLAGLRLLAANIASGVVHKYDGDIGAIWTNDGEHDGLNVTAIQELGDTLNGGVQPDSAVNLCSDCGLEVDEIIGCPDGSEVCSDCSKKH